MGLVEPELKPIGDNSISLRMPMVSEGAKADIRNTIKQTAKLEFYLVDPNNQAKVAEYNKDPENFRPSPGYRYAEIENEVDGEVRTEVIFISKRPERLRGEEVKQAVPNVNNFGNWSVSLVFNARGTKAFGTITSEHVGERLAIVLDGKVYSAPNIKEAITGGRAEITGNFTFEEARRLAGVIESGNLPVSISIDSEFGTDPTLGRDSIRSGLWAAGVGMVLVVLFMLWYYRIAGAVAILALICNMILVLGTLTLTGATITLPGIAGMVLTIGMAVDANVLIFERIREELRNGKTIGNAVKAGYGRAFVTILDSNLTTLLTALILYRFGTGPIRGFAVTLSIGIVASMFTALFMTRTIFDTALKRGALEKLGMVTLPWLTDCQYNFLGIKRITTGASITIATLSIICFVVRGHSALSIDFAGGTEIAYECSAGEPDVKAVRNLLNSEGFENVRVGYKYSPAQGARLLELTLPDRSTDEASLDLPALEKTLNETFPDAKLKQVQTNSVGSLVGEQFQKKAGLAAVLAIVGIIIYISFRFEFAYAVASVVALLHDVVIAAGLYLLTGRQLSLPVVAALLTIMGYSLNDTIVVFDRIREDLALHKGRGYVDIINLSINQTLSRTLLTSLTTLLVVVTLYLFGGGAINDFALVMLIGVIVGTYSSVFVASAIIASWHKRSRHHKEDTVAPTAPKQQVEA
jgi:SecD/SecF fusion protein